MGPGKVATRHRSPAGHWVGPRSNSLANARTSGDLNLVEENYNVAIVRFKEGNLSVAINFYTPHSDIVQIDAIQVILMGKSFEERKA